MEELGLYFVKSAGILLLFLALYFAVLRSETFFQENRFFMLSGMLISLLLPFVVITQYIDIPLVAQEMTGSFVYSTTDVPVETTSISWTSILIYLYLSGVIVFFIKFLVALFSLFRLLWKSDVSRRDGQFVYIETKASFSPFSFFNYIVYNPALYSASELEAILTHEQAHSRQMHSIDVFVSKLYCIFFWFNPFAWMHKKFMLQNLEFLADSAAIKQTPSKKEYQLTLLKVSGNTFCPALTNNFYNSLIKKRIVMLQKTQSTQTNRWKQMLILPMLIAFVFLFNTKVVAKEVSATTTNATTTATNTFIEDVDGDVLVTVDKNTTQKEFKAIQKMFKSFDITMKYDIKKTNSNKEITAIDIELKDKAGAAASATFESAEDTPIPTIKLGKKEGMLIVSSGMHTKHIGNSFTYEIHEDHDDEDGKEKDNKKIVVRTDKKWKVKANSWYSEDEIKTIDIKKEGGKEIIVIDGKVIDPKEMIEDEIEIKTDGKANTFTYSISTDSDEEEVEDKKFKIIKSKESKIVFNSSDSEKKPLIIVDGKEIPYGDLHDINPDKIESLTVLKDKAAIKEYGDKGKNGVILVKTKKKKKE